MKREQLTEKLLDIKREKGWTWKHICTSIGGFSDTLIVGAILGQTKLTKPQAAKAAELFGLSKTEEALIEEEFGDGIMSAIDFDFLMERVANPKGDRVKITMSGKFLPYKYYGASGNVPEYGFKEE